RPEAVQHRQRPDDDDQQDDESDQQAPTREAEALSRAIHLTNWPSLTRHRRARYMPRSTRQRNGRGLVRTSRRKEQTGPTWSGEVAERQDVGRGGGTGGRGERPLRVA